MTCPIGELGDHGDAVAELIDRAVHTIPFYEHHLARCNTARFGDLPTVSKRILASWGARPLATSCDRPARYCATSGTTASRMLVGFSANDWERLGSLLGARARALGLGEDDLLANTHGYGLWVGGPALDLMARGAGAGLLPLGPGHTDQLLTWLTELPITAISATPSFLRYLAERVRADEIPTQAWRLRLALAGGEGASAELRRGVSAILGSSFRWQELYGASEIGGPTLGWSPPLDPLCGRLLVDTDEFVVEVLQPDCDDPVTEGEVGEVTITTPYREVDPLIRYRTGDLACASLPEDSPSLPAISTILGRVDDALKVRGALVYPSAIEAVILEHCAADTEWRIVVDRDPGTLDTLNVVVEHTEGDAGGLADRLHERLGIRAVVTVVPPNSLARFEGKARRVSDRR